MRRRVVMVLRLLITCLLLQGSCLLADDWVYTVRPGDNLWNLAERHLKSFKYIRQLQQLNGVQDPYHIPPGKKIRIPLEWTIRQSTSARIANLHGKAVVKRGNSQRILQAEPDLQLFVGDEIQSEADSFVTIEFTDGSRLRVQESSCIRLYDLKIFGDLGLINTAVELKYGRVENIVPKNSESDSRFRIKTPSAISSVRGTEFRVGVLQEGAITASEVLTGALQVSGEQQTVNVDKGQGSVTSQGMPPLPPVKLLSAPDLSMTPELFEQLPLIIPVKAVSGAQAYRAQIARDAEFEHMLTEFTTTTLPFREGNLPDGNYWLRVRAIDISSLEGYDAVKAFTLNARPEPPFVITPQPGSILPGEQPVLKWATQSAASHYLVNISRESEFLSPLIFSGEVVENSLHLQDNLIPGEYFWQIASVSAEEGAGPFSDPMTFRVPVPGPSLEKLEVDKSSITFSWRAAAEGQRFHIQLARDKEFSQVLLDQETADTFITLPRPQGGKYFLRTKTIETDGFEGPYGAAQSVDIPYATPYWLMILLLPLLLLL